MGDVTYLTAAQAAERLQLREDTVLRWLREGKLPGAKLGRIWRIRPEALDRFIQEAERANLDTRRNGEGEEEPRPEDRAGEPQPGGPAEEYDDEPLSAEDWAALREGIAAIRRGDAVNLEEYDRERQQRR